MSWPLRGLQRRSRLDCHRNIIKHSHRCMGKRDDLKPASQVSRTALHRCRYSSFYSRRNAHTGFPRRVATGLLDALCPQSAADCHCRCRRSHWRITDGETALVTEFILTTLWRHKRKVFEKWMTVSCSRPFLLGPYRYMGRGKDISSGTSSGYGFLSVWAKINVTASFRNRYCW